MKELIKRALGTGSVVYGERFKGKVAVVTGASNGIGLATARAFAREGARVALIARREAEGNEAAALVKKTAGDGADAMFIRADVSDGAQVRAAFAKIHDAYGGLDIAFNNAGAMHAGGRIAALSEEDFDRIMAVNVKGLWMCMHEEIRLMEARGTRNNSAIVNMSSISGLVGQARYAFYSASKHAVLGLTKCAALEYAGVGIRVNAICPGYVRTEMTTKVSPETVKQRCPTGRVSEPDEVAAAVLWMCSPDASYLVGHPLVLDGGNLGGTF